MTDVEYQKSVKAKILAYRTYLRADGHSLPYVNIRSVDDKTTQAIKLVEQARHCLQLAADEL